MTMLTRPEGLAPSDLNQTRRTLGAMFFAGFALAGASASAEPIHTSDAGLITGEVSYASPSGGQLPAYVARPAAKGAHPAVIVVSEIFGVHEYIRDICRRLAGLGYVAIAPAFFFRAGDPAPLTDMGEIMKIVATAGHEQVMGDVQGTLGWLSTQLFVDNKKIAITGFCWGGAVVWMSSARFPQIKAGVAWYGRLARPTGDSPAAREDRPWPLDVVKDLHAPVLGLYAGEDHGIPVSDVERMREALKQAHKPGELVIYPHAQHGFHADYRESYDPSAAADGWARLKAWLASHGAGA